MTKIIRIEVWALLIGFLIVITCKLLSGRINLEGLLYDESRSGNFSPGRVQLLVVSLAVAFYYLSKVFQNPQVFPEMPKEMLCLLGGGNFIYLGGKGLSLFKKTGLLP